MDDHTDTLPTTTLPCPDWCTQPTGHGFHSTDKRSGHLLRDHSRDVGTVSAVDRYDEQARTTYVGICTWETAASDDGPILTVDPRPRVTIDEGAHELTSGQARELAALVVEAAKLVESIGARGGTK